MGEYEFNADLDTAEVSERQVARFMERTFNLKFVSTCNNSDWDLVFANLRTGEQVTVEVKEDFYCEDSGNVAIEYECRGKPSGIWKTKSDFYVYKIHRPDGTTCLYLIQTPILKKLIKDYAFTHRVKGGDAGSNTWFYLFRLDHVKKNWANLGVVPA